MLNKIKQILFIIFLVLLTAGIIKDKVFDAPSAAMNRIKSYAEKNAKKSVNINLFETNRVLVYKMYFWSIFPMGEMKFSTKSSDKETVFRCEAITEGRFIKRLIDARASIESYFSKSDFLPYKCIEHTQVQGKIKEKIFIYDRENLLCIHGDEKIKISSDTLDSLGAFIRLMSIAFVNDKDHEISFLPGRDTYVLETRLLRSMNKINEVYVDIHRKNLTSSHGGRLHIWITSDNCRLPLMFKSWTPAGYASAILDRIENE